MLERNVIARQDVLSLDWEGFSLHVNIAVESPPCYNTSDVETFFFVPKPFGFAGTLNKVESNPRLTATHNRYTGSGVRNETPMT